MKISVVGQSEIKVETNNNNNYYYPLNLVRFLISYF